MATNLEGVFLGCRMAIGAMREGGGGAINNIASRSGWVGTPAALPYPGRAERMAAIVKDTPLRRFGEPDEVAALAVLLASNGAGYMTGSDPTLDGGLLAGTLQGRSAATERVTSSQVASFAWGGL